jgi:maltose O-acetyltransferase
VASHKDRMLTGEPYLADDPELLADRRACRLLIERLNSTSVVERDNRLGILRTLLGGIGEETEVLSPFQCDYGYQIEIGRRTFINFGAVILDSAPVVIGDDVQIGPGVQLVTPLHPLHPTERRTRYERSEAIEVGDGAWLAAGVIVCPGVSIGADAVVGAGSVVVSDLPGRHLCVGNPCRAMRKL